MPRLRKKKSENLLLKGRCLLFFLQQRPDSRFGHNYWGKKRASANQSLFFQIIAGQQLLFGVKKAKICISQLKNGFYSSASFLNYHRRPVWKKKSQMVEARGRRVSQEGGGRGGVSDQWGACCGESPPPVASSEMRRHACPHPLPTVTPPSWPLITIGL